MSSETTSFKNRARFIQLGIAISVLRKKRGISQEQLAENANMSRSHPSAIEAPGMVRGMSMQIFFNIADALDVDPAELINSSLFLDSVLKNNKSNLPFHLPSQRTATAYNKSLAVKHYKERHCAFRAAAEQEDHL